MGFFGRLFGGGDKGGNTGGAALATAGTDYRTLVEQAMAELQLRTQAHCNLWHLDEAEDWAADQSAGTITFTTATMTVTAPMQIVGTYNTANGTFMWGWDHPSVQPPLRKHAERVREYGQQNGVAALTTRVVECTEAEAWEFAAVACKLNGAQGAYRGPAGTALVFMTFGEVQLTKREETA